MLTRSLSRAARWPLTWWRPIRLSRVRIGATFDFPPTEETRVADSLAKRLAWPTEDVERLSVAVQIAEIQSVEGRYNNGKTSPPHPHPSLDTDLEAVAAAERCLVALHVRLFAAGASWPELRAAGLDSPARAAAVLRVLDTWREIRDEGTRLVVETKTKTHGVLGPSPPSSPSSSSSSSSSWCSMCSIVLDAARALQGITFAYILGSASTDCLLRVVQAGALVLSLPSAHDEPVLATAIVLGVHIAWDLGFGWVAWRVVQPWAESARDGYRATFDPKPWIEVEEAQRQRLLELRRLAATSEHDDQLRR